MNAYGGARADLVEGLPEHSEMRSSPDEDRPPRCGFQRASRPSLRILEPERFEYGRTVYPALRIPLDQTQAQAVQIVRYVRYELARRPRRLLVLPQKNFKHRALERRMAG